MTNFFCESFFTDAVDIFCLLLKNVDFIVFTSEVTKSNHIWKSFFLAAFLSPESVLIN